MGNANSSPRSSKPWPSVLRSSSICQSTGSGLLLTGSKVWRAFYGQRFVSRDLIWIARMGPVGFQPADFRRCHLSPI